MERDIDPYDKCPIDYFQKQFFNILRGPAERISFTKLMILILWIPDTFNIFCLGVFGNADVIYHIISMKYTIWQTSPTHVYINVWNKNFKDLSYVLVRNPMVLYR